MLHTISANYHKPTVVAHNVHICHPVGTNNTLHFYRRRLSADGSASIVVYVLFLSTGTRRYAPNSLYSRPNIFRWTKPLIRRINNKEGCPRAAWSDRAATTSQIIEAVLVHLLRLYASYNYTTTLLISASPLFHLPGSIHSTKINSTHYHCRATTSGVLPCTTFVCNYDCTVLRTEERDTLTHLLPY